MAEFEGDQQTHQADVERSTMAAQLHIGSLALCNRILELARKQHADGGVVLRGIARLNGSTQYPIIEHGPVPGEHGHTLHTPILFTTEGETLKGMPVSYGLVFSAPQEHISSGREDVLSIYDTATDLDSGETTFSRRYVISTEGPQSNRLEFWVRGGVFDDYCRKVSELEDKKEKEKAATRNKNEEPVSLFKQPEFWDSFFRDFGGRMDFPDGLYKEPAGLVWQANKALGTKLS